MFAKAKWIRENAGKLCPSLKRKIFDTYRHNKWIPCFLHRLLEAIKQRLFKQRVIVQFNTPDYSATADIHKLADVLGYRVKHDLSLINGFSTSVNIRTLRKMLNNPTIARVWYDQELHAVLDVATPVTNAPTAWNTGNEGQGVGIAVVDTGIYPHPDLITPENRITGFKDFVNGRANPYDDNGHGTHCAGDAAGNGFQSNGKYKGPAPKANLIGVKVLNKTGSGAISKIIAGIQWCIDNKDRYSIKVISMSLGGTAAQSAGDDPLCQAVKKAWETSIVVCAAAGNEGPSTGTISTPGIEPKIITVGALDDKNTTGIDDDAVASFSSRGPTRDGLVKPDLLCPGVNIVSLRSPYSYLDKASKNSRVGEWYNSLSGTSMATPVCAGVAALLAEKLPHSTPDEIKSLLVKSCRKIDPDPNAQGAGLVDAGISTVQFN